ncbi:hypothetical protein FA13DRAFT_1793518 [Coprinellus micaceus]|uniref:MYND-type domain-containing protein n=1 Tax=Coprinellus micaceus TaxID=71717 RepID=A0A4Y7T4C9_COPMI|nr:hypothetical protein FA13DRAFT_1793518 [Coprinellus micaceus]
MVTFTHPTTQNRRLPNQVHISEKILLDNAVKVIINLIHIALAGLPKHEFLPNPENDEIPPWPTNAKDLFPFSLLDTIYGFDFWVEWFGIQGWEIYRLCDLLVGYYQPFSQAILQEPFPRPKEHSSSQEFFILPIQFLTEWFKTLLLQHPQENFREMIRENAATVVPVLTGLRSRLSPLNGAHWENIRVGLKVLVSLANDSVDTLHLGQRTVEVKWKRTPQDALLAMRAAHRGGCSNLGCPHKQEAVQTRVCGKCGILRFCGEKCQKEAWKDPIFPHKKLCSQIYATRQAVGPHRLGDLSGRTTPKPASS